MRFGPFTHVEASEVLLLLAQASEGRTAAHERVEAAEDFWISPRNQLALLLKEFLMQLSMVRGHAVQGNLAFVRVLKKVKYF